MQLSFIKNIQFTKLIKADGRLREFNFRRYTSANQTPIFSVNVVDNRDNRILFEMQKEENVWKIIKQPLPTWVIENEDNFHECIEDELRLS